MSTIRGLLNLVRNAEKLGEPLKLKRSDVELLNAHMIKKVEAHSPLTASDMAIGNRLGKFNAPLLHEIRLSYGKDGKFIGKKASAARKASHSARVNEAKAKRAAASKEASESAKKQRSEKERPNEGNEKRYNADDFHNQKSKESPFKDEPKSKSKKKKGHRSNMKKDIESAQNSLINKMFSKAGKMSRTNIAVGSAAGGIIGHSIFSGDSKD